MTSILIVDGNESMAEMFTYRLLMRMLPLLLGVMAFAPTWAVAGEPTGFDGWAFGTTRRALVAAPVFRARCHPAPETQEPSGVAGRGSRVTCPSYEVNDLGPMPVAFLFSSEDRLVSYVIYFTRHRHDDVRSKAESLYGPPMGEWEPGQSISWRWPSGTEAILTIFCRGTDGCLVVTAKGPGTNSRP